MVAHSDHFGFTRTDLGALEDPQLSNKSYQGPGQESMFWDASHLTSKGHVLVAKVFQAMLRGNTLGIRVESDGFRLTCDSLQIGKTYYVQQSGTLLYWEDVTTVSALEPRQETVVPPSPPPRFYRLMSK